MREQRSWRRGAAIVAVLALTATACGGDDGDDTGTEPATDGTTQPTDGGTAGEVLTDIGVTEEPCPNAVNADNGCIYLGILSDLTQGPFAPLGVEIVAGQEAFFQRINEQGGIAGHDIDVTTYTRDNLYTQDEHVAKYREIEPNILALAQSLGTPTTLAALQSYIDDNVVALPASWWSGWSVPEEDGNVILESGYPYCIESMNGLDWWSEQGNEVTKIMSVGYPGDYGGDGAAGAEAWAEANSVEYLGFTETGPNSIVGNQDAAVGAILQAQPDVVQVSTGPSELGEIVGKAVAQGFAGQFIGSVPTYNPALLQSPVADALKAKYVFVAPWGPFGSESAAHDAMAEAVGDDLPANDGFTFGWIWSYPMKALLETAAANGDLTRAGLVAALDGLEIDYEGALPTRTFSGDTNSDVVRVSYISAPDDEAPLGASVLEAEYTGPTAEAYEFTEACQSV